MAISATTVAMISSLPSKEVATNIDADGLNQLWTQLTTAFDAYYDSIEPPKVRDTVNQAIVDWQNFYFGNQGQWPADGVVLWRTIYQKTLETMAAAIPSGAKPTEQVKAPATAGKQGDEVFYITGRAEPTVLRDVSLPIFVSPIRLSSPYWLAFVAVGLPVATYLFARNRRIR